MCFMRMTCFDSFNFAFLFVFILRALPHALTCREIIILLYAQEKQKRGENIIISLCEKNYERLNWIELKVFFIYFLLPRVCLPSLIYIQQWTLWWECWIWFAFKKNIYICFIGFLWVNEKAFLSCLYVKRWVIEKFVNSLKHEFLRKYNFLFLSLIPFNTTSMFLNSSYKTHLRYNFFSKVAWRGWFKSEKKLLLIHWQHLLFHILHRITPSTVREMICVVVVAF